MHILITGGCGFVGSWLAQTLRSAYEGVTVIAADNLSRPGSEINRRTLIEDGIRVIHSDIRMMSDVTGLPKVDWVIDAAAIPSVLAGLYGDVSPRQLLEQNVLGTLEILEYCRNTGAGLIFLSTSRVYSIPMLATLPLRTENRALVLDDLKLLPTGVTSRGISTAFSTSAPISLYGSSKLASEALALEYGATFGFPVWINRCGVLAAERQFGTREQGIFTYWIHAHRAGLALKYVGFGGYGHQTRDVLHPRDLATLIWRQIQTSRTGGCRLYSAGGGLANAISLAQLTAWCDDRFSQNVPEADLTDRAFDVPWIVMDTHGALLDFCWETTIPLEMILDEIARHASREPHWLDLCQSSCSNISK